MGEPYVSFYPGQDFSRVIRTLIELADPHASVSVEPTFRNLLFEIDYDEDTDWMAEALRITDVVGMRLHQIAGTWVLGPNVGLNAAEVRAIAFEVAQETSTAIVSSLSRQAG